MDLRAKCACECSKKGMDWAEGERSPGCAAGSVIPRSKLEFLHLAYSEVGDERGERVVSHFRSSARHRPQQRRLACVGNTNQADIRHKNHGQHEPPLLGPSRGAHLLAIARTSKHGAITFSTVSAGCDEHAFARLGELPHRLIRITLHDHAVWRYSHYEIVATAPIPPSNCVVPSLSVRTHATLEVRQCVVVL